MLGSNLEYIISIFTAKQLTSVLIFCFFPQKSPVGKLRILQGWTAMFGILRHYSEFTISLSPPEGATALKKPWCNRRLSDDIHRPYSRQDQRWSWATPPTLYVPPFLYNCSNPARILVAFLPKNFPNFAQSSSPRQSSKICVFERSVPADPLNHGMDTSVEVNTRHSYSKFHDFWSFFAMWQ